MWNSLPASQAWRDRVQEVQARHVLVRHLGVHADELGMGERRDEAEIRAGGRHVDVAARLVRLRFHREAVAVLLVDRVLAEVVDRVAQALDGLVRPAARVGLGPFTPAPEHEDLCPELGAEVHGAQRLLHRVGPHPRIVRREGAVAEHRIVEEVDGGHRHDDAGALAGRLELLDDLVAFGRGGVDRHQVVVVQVHAPRADLAEHGGGVVGRQRRADDVAEGIAAAVADRPEAEGKLVLGFRDRKRWA